MHIFSSPLLWCKPMFLSNKCYTLSCFDIACNTGSKIIRKVMLVSADSSPLFDRSSRCSKAMNTRTNDIFVYRAVRSWTSKKQRKTISTHTVLFGNLAYAFSLLNDKLSWNSCKTTQKHKCYSRYLIALGSSTISFTTWKKIDILSLQ